VILEQFWRWGADFGARAGGDCPKGAGKAWGCAAVFRECKRGYARRTGTHGAYQNLISIKSDFS